MRRTLLQAFRLVPGPLRRRWLALAPLAALSALLEAVAAAGILGLIELIGDPGAESSRLLGAVRGAIGGEGGAFVLRFAVALGLFFAAKNLYRLGEAYMQFRVAGDTGVAMTARLMRSYLEAPYALHLRRNSAEMVHLLTKQLAEVWLVLQAGVSLASETLVVFAVIGVLVAAAPWSALAVALLLGAVLFGILRFTYVWHGRWGLRLHERGMAFMKAVQESLGGVKEIKAGGHYDYFVERTRQTRSGVADLDVRRQASEHIPRLGVETVFVCGLALLIWSAGGAGAGAGLTTTLGLMAYAGLRLLPSMQLIIYRAERISLGAAGVEAAWNDMENLPPEGGSDEDVRFEREIAFERVGFSYEGATRPALSELSFAIARGESIGVVGPTGAGKSTLLDLLLGLLEPEAGRIAIDGADLRGHERAWRRKVGYVPQSVTLLDDTIRRNIALGVDESGVDEERLGEAVRMAQLEDFVAALPGGLETMVGERGVRVSGGERQRLAVARALYGRPDVLLFDEATAALDNRTEQALTETIERLHGRKTMILIAHRLSTVRRCDRLVFLREGRVADVGAYGELIERNAEFRAMAVPAEIS
jgi:ATP-binding cassette subfamily C protein